MRTGRRASTEGLPAGVGGRQLRRIYIIHETPPGLGGTHSRRRAQEAPRPQTATRVPGGSCNVLLVSAERPARVVWPSRARDAPRSAVTPTVM